MKDWLSIDSENIWHPFTPLVGANAPILVSKAEGIYLHTEDGRKIIDAIASWWVNIHGHSNPEIAKAIYDQALNLEHVIFAGFTHEPAIRLSQNLLSILPKNQKRIFFSDNGSTAVEVALKMAIQYWHNRRKEKKKIIAIDGAYHGDTFGAMSVGERGLFTRPFDNFLFEVHHIPFPGDVSATESLRMFESLLHDGDVAAFIFEPLIQGAAGMRIYDKAFLNKFMALAKENDTLCIADEVFTGFGRTGEWFASHHLDHQPDIMAISKGITGGTMPLGVTSCSAEIVNAFETDEVSKTFFHGHSYTANPLACAAANKSFEILLRPECKERILSLSKIQQQFCIAIQKHPRVSFAKSLGTILSIELRTEESTSYTNSLRKRIYDYFLAKEILLRPLGNVIYIVPPYIMLVEELERIHSEIIQFLNES